MTYDIHYKSDCCDIDFEQIKLYTEEYRHLMQGWFNLPFPPSPVWQEDTFPALYTMLDVIVNGGYKGGKPVRILADSDCDGYLSAAIMYNTVNAIYSRKGAEYKVPVEYILHTEKRHGITSDAVFDPKDTSVLIVPDAGTNDTEACNDLFAKNVNVLILDHHPIERSNFNALVINCKDGKYKNPELCGTGMAYKFLEYADALLHLHLDNDFADLAAVATIADMVSVRNHENMGILKKGLHNIKHPLLCEFVRQNELDASHVTVEDVKFKIAPYLNALIRAGSMEEKDLLFQSLIGSDKVFDYEKRGSFEITTETIYERVVRLAKNAKARQDRAKNKAVTEAEKKGLLKETECLIVCETETDVDESFNGLIANEIASTRRKPTIVGKIGSDGCFRGSMRNYGGSPIQDLKGELLATGCMESVMGHENAAGVCIPHECIEALPKKFEERLKSAPVYIPVGAKFLEVDFLTNAENIDAGFIKRMTFFDDFTGEGVRDVNILVKNIRVVQDGFSVMGKNCLNWKIDYGDFSIANFKVGDRDPLIEKMNDLSYEVDEQGVIVDAICKCSINFYKGVAYPQLVVRDYEIKGTYIIDEAPDLGEDEYDDDFDFEI